MIDRQGGKILIECDSCDTVESSEEGQEFGEFWAGLKQHGWRTRKIADEWLHSCPRCKAPT